MKKILTGALAALTVGGVVLGGASTASAREWHGGGGNAGAAVAAGIAGLAIGAALASSNHGYYGSSYAPAYGYYGRSYAPAYYGGYADDYGYAYRRHCRLETRWNRWDGYERVRVCY